jgi:hypothetical protein
VPSIAACLGSLSLPDRHLASSFTLLYALEHGPGSFLPLAWLVSSVCLAPSHAESRVGNCRQIPHASSHAPPHAKPRSRVVVEPCMHPCTPGPCLESSFSPACISPRAFTPFAKPGIPCTTSPSACTFLRVFTSPARPGPSLHVVAQRMHAALFDVLFVPATSNHDDASRHYLGITRRP